MPKPLAERLRRNLLSLAHKKGLTIEKLALEAELSKSHLSLIISGHSSISLAALERLAEVLEVDVVDVLAPVKKR
jgi:transcriptional regulator with XRE-family HTH domain